MKEIIVGLFSYPTSNLKQGNHLFVTNQWDNTVSVINLNDYAVSKTIEAGEHPESIDAHPSENYVDVADCFDGTISVIDTERLELIESIKTGEGSRAFGRFVMGKIIRP